MGRRLTDKEILTTLKRVKVSAPCVLCKTAGTVVYGGRRLCDRCAVAAARYDDAPARSPRKR